MSRVFSSWLRPLVVVLCAACPTASKPVAQVTLIAPPVAVVDAGPDVQVDASDTYAKRLDAFLRDHWSMPSGASHLCVSFQVNISPHMILWHVRSNPSEPSGDDRFDDSVRGMLQRLVDTRTPLPEPPAEIADTFKGKSVQLLQCR